MEVELMHLRSTSTRRRAVVTAMLAVAGGLVGCGTEESFSDHPEAPPTAAQQSEVNSHWAALTEEGDPETEERSGATDEDRARRALVWPPPHILCWDTPVTAVSLGQQPDPLVLGHSLKEIVSSQVIVRPDGLGCSDCHYQDNFGSPGDHYRPPIPQGSTANIYPWTKGRLKHKPEYLNPDDPYMTWRGEFGYSQTNTWMFMSFTKFFLSLAAVNNKPQSVAVVLMKWRDDGYCTSLHPVQLPHTLTP